MGFSYGNFFIPWVEKNLKISPWEGKAYLWEETFLPVG
jgi:hypothetical protein